MNYLLMAKNSMKKNVRKQITFIITCIIAITFHFLYTTLIYNNGTILIAKASILGIILKASIGIIIIILSFFTIYSYTSYIRLRSREFKIKLLIGMTRGELALCILFENLILMAACLSIGILLGTIFSKFFFLVIINYLGFPNLLFSLGTVNYISTLEFFIILYVIITLRTLKLLKKPATLKKSILLKPTKKVKGLVYILLIIADLGALVYQANNGGVLYLYIWISCMLILYGMVFYLRKFAFNLMKKTGYFNKSNFLLLKQFSRNIEKDNLFIFLIAYSSFLFITYNLVCEVGVFNKYSYEISSNGLKIFRLITLFTNLLFFAISSSITYFKFQMELESIARYFKKLYMLGITKEEFDFLIKYRLRILFFLPCTLCAITSVLFVLTGTHIRHFGLNQGVIATSYFYNIYGYKKAKKLYMEAELL